MPIEEGEFISDFVSSNPLGSDFKSEGPAHFELLKQWIQNTFPQLDGAMERSQAQLNQGACPIGTFIFFGGVNVPDGYLSCDGQVVEIEDYPDLYAAIGDLWNNTDGAGNPQAGSFRLPPQVRSGLGCFLRGHASGTPVGTSQNSTNLSHTHVASTNSTGNHTHSHRAQAGTVNSVYVGGGTAFQGLSTMGLINSGNIGTTGAHTHTVTVNNQGNASEARPVNITALMCIRAEYI